MIRRSSWSRSRVSAILLFDIDGTLIDAGGAARRAARGLSCRRHR